MHKRLFPDLWIVTFFKYICDNVNCLFMYSVPRTKIYSSLWSSHLFFLIFGAFLLWTTLVTLKYLLHFKLDMSWLHFFPWGPFTLFFLLQTKSRSMTSHLGIADVLSSTHHTNSLSFVFPIPQCISLQIPFLS